MKWLLAFLALVLPSALVAYPDGNPDGVAFTIPKTIFEGTAVPFQPHDDPQARPFASYLIMNLPFEPAGKLYDDLKQQINPDLISRREAHITVITPPEYDDVLKAFVPMSKINEIAQRMEIQKSKFTLECVGRAQANIDGVSQQTYYAKITSEDLLRIRREIFKEFVRAGGDASHFDPDHFYSHITLGFTLRDLQESDGIAKSKYSCINGLKAN